MQTIFYMISERRLRWLGHVSRMSDGRIPKDILYGELAEGTRARGRPILRFKDVCKRDMKAGNMDPDSFGELTVDRSGWRQSVKSCVANAEKTRLHEAEEKRAKKKKSKSETTDSTTDKTPLSSFFCPYCTQGFQKQNALYSHLRTHHRSCVDWSSGSLTTYSCPHCRLVHRTQNGLYSHLRTHHRSNVDWTTNPS